MAQTAKRRLLISGVIIALLLCTMPAAPAVVAAQEVKEVALDFDDVDIRLFIRVISELTGKNFIVDNKVRGKVTVLSPRKLTVRQAYEVFKSVLSVNGFTVVEAGKVTKIVPAANMSTYGLPVGKRKVIYGEDQFITQIIPIKYLDPVALQPVIKPLLSPQATILVPPSSDLLIVTDMKSNINKIDKLLDEIDVEIADTNVERLNLKYSAPMEASSKITEILEAKYGKERKGLRPAFFKMVPVERINAVIVVAPSDVMMEIRSVLNKIDQPAPEGKSMLHVYYLENAVAEDMVQILAETQGSLSARTNETTTTAAAPEDKTEAGGTVVGGKMKVAGKDVTITADRSTNSLIIYASPDDYHAIEGMIRKLDIPRKQVYIEVLIMEVSPDEQFQFGTEWEGFRDVGHPFTDQATTGVIGGSKVEQSALDQLFEGGTEALAAGLTLGMVGETIAIGDFVFPSLSFLIRAVDSLATVNVLSKPQLLTLNNETASINISENRPFQTTETQLEGGGTSQNLEYRDVGITLELTPHINKAGKVRLEISQEVDRISDLVTATQPVTRKRAIDTVVEVQNGHIVVIGGLIEEQQDFSRGQVPCLGGLKFFGWAFKSIDVDTTRTNLLVFISPRVVETGKDADSLSIEKMEHMEREKSRFNQEVQSEQPWFMEHAPKKENSDEQETAE